ncbi:hypothetical protein TNCV_4865041 [Trichonephila clavipes]|nr:hypothetical protein TNCV_4865041 [Trichonephila clavipes]
MIPELVTHQISTAPQHDFELFEGASFPSYSGSSLALGLELMVQGDDHSAITATNTSSKVIQKLLEDH